MKPKRQLIVFVQIALVLARAAGQDTPASVSILDAGAAGDGMSDDSFIIQQVIDESPDGSVIDFGAAATFLTTRTITLKPNRQYSGTSTVIMAAWVPLQTPMLRLPYGQSSDITVDSLTFDANLRGGILQLDVGGSVDVPATNITIRNCTFKNTPGGQAADSAIYTPVGLQNATITRNHFQTCSSCISIANPNDVSITYNDFDTVSGNAISVLTYNFPFTYGNNVDISYNTGQNLGQMAIEIFNADPNTHMEAPTITYNKFSTWLSAQAKFPFGISVVVGHAAQITNNVLSSDMAGYGIEVGVPEAYVADNTIVGFAFGIVIQGQPDVTIKHNSLRRQPEAAIFFSNSGSNLRAQILNNTIINAQKFGIGSYPTDYGNSVISGNTITRQIGFFPEDANPVYAFVGIKIDSGLKSPVTVTNNRIIQTAAVAPATFSFWGIGVFGLCAGCTFERNTVESKSIQPSGVGFFLWFGNFVDSATITDNHFINLARVTNGYITGRVIGSGNTTLKVLSSDPYIIKVRSRGF